MPFGHLLNSKRHLYPWKHIITIAVASKEPPFSHDPEGLNMSSPHGILFCLISVIFLFNAAARTSATQLQGHNGTEEMVPMIEQGKMEMVMLSLNQTTRRKLGSFQICALCTCCGGANRVCLPSPCCYAINCNIPNRPFGFCSFTPKTCNCFGCHL